ncbi:unnamed protein product [marine sediment metagenome]|uniref:Phage head-tail adaptor n=1 Tax=marine sediment metagenome TaxID=412755 RepID=X0WGD7_9ZZZZ
MNIGKMNRRIRIETFTTAKDSFGQPIKTWVELKSVWANVWPVSNIERFEAAQVNRQVELRMHIHYRTDVTEQMRILYDGDYYDIQGIKEIGFREGLAFRCGLWKPEGG